MSNYIRFRFSPDSSIALAARVKLAGQDFVGQQRELFLSEDEPGEETPYERLLEMRWLAMGRSLPASMLSRQHGPWSIRHSNTIKGFTSTDAEVGDQKRRV